MRCKATFENYIYWIKIFLKKSLAGLGDPLIKGLTEVANRRPPDPIAFLANYLMNFAKGRNGLTSPGARSNSAVIKVDPELESQDTRDSGEGSSASTQLATTNGTEHHQLVKAGTMEMDDDMSDGRQSTVTSDDRDEHGQSILHFACARSHGKNALLQLIEESDSSITYRDELYRTARDVSLQANQPENAKEIDRYVMGLAARGDIDALSTLAIEGYDHILDVTDSEGTTIEQVAQARGHTKIVEFMAEIRDFEVRLLTWINEIWICFWFSNS